MSDLKLHTSAVVQAAGKWRAEFVFCDGESAEVCPSVISIRVQLEMPDQYPRVAEVQKVGLQHVQAVIEKEIQRLRAAQGRTP